MRLLRGGYYFLFLRYCAGLMPASLITRAQRSNSARTYFAASAGVVGMAALACRKFEVAPDEKVCAVVSGGNIDLNLLARLIESGLAAQGATHLVEVRVSDVPGQLYQVLGILAETRCNILDVQHYRAGWQVPVGFVDVAVLIETRHPGQGAEVEELPDGLRITAGPTGGHVTLDPEGDHRMAMCFALLGLRLPGIHVADPGCVTKSYAGFFEMLARFATYPV